MLELLTQIDRDLFLLINRSWANGLTDLIMPVVTNDWVLRIALGIVLIILLIRGSAKTRWLVLGCLVVVALADLTTAKFLKPLIDRPRPCHELEQINVLVNCGAGRSMPSAHAANSFAVAGYFGSLFPRWSIALMLVAFIVAISRVFVGVHYPADILVGGLIGLVIGRLSAHLAAFGTRRLKSSQPNTTASRKRSEQ